MAAGFAFHPEFLAGTAPEMSFPCGQRGFEGFAVHPGHHQNTSTGLVLDDRRNEAFGVKFQFVVKTHHGRQGNCESWQTANSKWTGSGPENPWNPALIERE